MNTEAPIDTPSILVPGSPQHQWLDNGLLLFLCMLVLFHNGIWRVDLAKARANPNTPWIIIGGHRPFYCVPSGGKDCGQFAAYMRDCLEEMFYKYKVDLVVNAHMHNYEVTWPTYKSVGYPSYVNPPAPVYIVSHCTYYVASNLRVVLTHLLLYFRCLGQVATRNI